LTPVFFVTIEAWLEKRRNVDGHLPPAAAGAEEPRRA
jgi:hypothetical protein